MSEPASTTDNNTSTTGAANVDATAGTPRNLTKVKVDSQNTAFNLIVSFVGVAQRRGTFALDEAAKIYECIEMFKNDN
jgi:hypothetical protein